MVEMTRKQIIDSEYTMECPTCNYILIGNDPTHYVKCDKCFEVGEFLYGEEVVHAYPDGWSCVSCGTSFDKKTIDVECLYVIHNDEGTKCLKCYNEQATTRGKEEK